MIIIVTGPSGSGKTTAGEYLETRGLRRIITSTTRPMRQGEVQDRSYHFLTEDEFNTRDFVERSCYSGNWYGTEISEMNKAEEGREDVFAVLDGNGVRAFKERYGDMAIVIYVDTSTRNARKRMLQRGDNLGKVIERIRFRKKSREEENRKIADFTICNNFSLNHLHNALNRILLKVKKN